MSGQGITPATPQTSTDTDELPRSGSHRYIHPVTRAEDAAA